MTALGHSALESSGTPGVREPSGKQRLLLRIKLRGLVVG